ncbi:hypothetical protein ACG90B_20120 [Acinetobacter baumannii]|uniref:hypothetical protein n=1 Tax=Acinetobacter baumannii TaxID=470 RepID=UPI003AF4A4C1
MESSNDKTVRKMINYLSNYEWMYQYSMFVDVLSFELDEAKDVAKNWLLKFDDKKFRDYLRKKKGNEDVAMMYVIRKTIHKNHPSKKSFQQFYITMYSSNEIHGLDHAQSYSDFPLNILRRRVTDTKIKSTCSALKNQKLHDISSLNGKNRYSIINQAKLIPLKIASS